MAKQTLLKKFEGLTKKTEQNDEKYLQKIDEKNAEILRLQDEVQEKQSYVKSLHKMKILGDVTEETYEAEKKELERLENKLTEERKELKLIQDYKHEDAVSIVKEMEEVKKEHKEEENTEIRKIQLEMLQAKVEYFEKLKETRKRYLEITQPRRKVADLKEKLGIKRRSFTGDTFEHLHQVSVQKSNGHSTYEQLHIEQPEIYHVLTSGYVPSHLRDAVDKAKKDGVVK